MKTYDPKAVEALLKNIWKQEISTPLSSTDIFYFAAAVRDSAREAGEVSEEELFEFIQESLMGTRGLEAAINNALISYHEDKISEMVLSIADVIEPTVRAALSRFGQQGAGAEAARRYSEGKISAGKFGELLGLEPGELHDFKTACGAFDEERHMELLGQPRGRVDRCKWSEDSDGTWETACGKAFIVIEGRPDENDMEFCCYCGSRIEQVNYNAAPGAKEE